MYAAEWTHLTLLSTNCVSGKTKVVSGNLRAQGSPVISSGFSFITRNAEKEAGNNQKKKSKSEHCLVQL